MIFFYQIISFTIEDECGLTFVNQNAGKIVGGIVAAPYSWPASALVRFFYKKDLLIDGNITTQSWRYTCGGNTRIYTRIY